MEDNLVHYYYTQLCNYQELPYFDSCKTQDYILYKIKQQDLPWEDVITHVNIGLNHEFYTNIKRVQHPCRVDVLVNKYKQLSCDYIPSDLEVIAPDYSEEGLVLRRAARNAFEKMSQAAQREGNYLKAISTYRSYSYQEKVYNKNMTPNISLKDYQMERDKVSARAGHSEHQTGLAVDINDLEETFEETKESRWLMVNAYQFGFIMRYSKGKENITGYNYEPWHYRYLGEQLAEAVYFSNLTYDEFYIRFLSCR